MIIDHENIIYFYCFFSKLLLAFVRQGTVELTETQSILFQHFFQAELFPKRESLILSVQQNSRLQWMEKT